MSETLTQLEARRLWIHAQKLDVPEPFGKGPKATPAAIEHLGYVQIDTIHVIERCHHHILYNRIPSYRRSHLHQAQTLEKTVFEYWTHALAYVPVRDYRYFMKSMKERETSPGSWYRSVKKEELQKVMKLVRKEGPISIRDIEDDVLVEKDHEWASRKPSKRALQLAFFSGRLAISERVGMLKKFELSERHFNWETKPRPASEKEILAYRLDRALRSQGVVSLNSVCHLEPRLKPRLLRVIESRVKKKELIGVKIRGLEQIGHWATTQSLQERGSVRHPEPPGLTHLLSPFDPLIIQRKRLHQFFDYEHRFEAYLPKEKRVFGYFALPVLMGDQIVAALDLKTARAEKRLLIQKWTWIGKSQSRERKKTIEEALGRFERFQLEN